MSRHLSPLHLAQLDTDPDPPPAGHLAVYAGQDGTLRGMNPAGRPARLAPWRTSRADTDLLVPPDQSGTPALSLDVQPGLHEIRAYLVVRPYEANRVLMGMDLAGPATSLLHATTTVIYSPDNETAYTYATAEYGPLTHQWMFWIMWGAPVIQLRVDGVVDVTEAGTLSLAPTVQRMRWSYDMSWPYDWNTNGGELNAAETPAHSEGGSALLTASGEDGWAELWRSDTFSGSTYRYTAWLYSPAGWSSAGLTIYWYDDSGSQVGQGQLMEPIPAGEWKQYVIEGQAPESASRAEVYVSMAGSPPAGTELYVDDVVLEQMSGQLQVSAGSLLAASPM